MQIVTFYPLLLFVLVDILCLQPFFNLLLLLFKLIALFRCVCQDSVEFTFVQ